MKYDAVIIGAGSAGLFAALKLSSRGKKVLLLEKQSVPGGLATTFVRKGFCFESSLHCVDNLGVEGEIRNFLDESGVSSKINFIELSSFMRLIYPGHNLLLDFNLKNFLKQLVSSFPHEKTRIDAFNRSLEAFYRQFESFSDSSFSLWLRAVGAPFIYPQLWQASCATADEFIRRSIRDQKARSIIADLWRFLGLPPKRLSALYFLLVFKGYLSSPTAYVQGGFSRLWEAVAEKIKENGSDIRYNAQAVLIETEKGRVKSVISDSQEKFSTDTVI
ncbi:MAG: FAD-dependent oxidoreductase, partial [Candidatus Omnitrophica bacterium]|nr:FAD-dependent oxidoreductase [Candidatus Omnitrophota bacterium]